MKQRIPVVLAVSLAIAAAGWANPIPVPPPANMPLEVMSIVISRDGADLHAAFDGNFTFVYIPTTVTAMKFPVPTNAENIGVGAPWVWTWSVGSYPTVLPEDPNLPMIEWDGPFPQAGCVFHVEYEHDLIERPGEFILLYALGTGKYYPTYEKVTEARFDITLPDGFGVGGVWLDTTPVDPNRYTMVGRHLTMTLTSEFGPFKRDLIVSLVPEPATVSLLALGGLTMIRRRRRQQRVPRGPAGRAGRLPVVGPERSSP